MNLSALLQDFTLLDLIALGSLLVGWLGLGWIIENPPKSRPSTSVLVAELRRDWMRCFVTRQPRLFDASVVDSLRNSTAFFASTILLALGACVALLGDVERMRMIASDFTLQSSRHALEIKIILVMILVANAFLKFVWANRLFGYCSIMMAAVPNDPEHPVAYPRAAQAAEVNVSAARSFNRGLQSTYFAMAALAWIAGAVPLMAAVAITCGVMIRREFTSASRQAILTDLRDNPL